MKRILSALSALVLVALLSTGCNKNSPKAVATTWLTSFYHLDYETAKTLSTEDTKTLLATLQQFTSIVPDSNKKEMRKITVNVKKVDEKGDTAIATYVTSDMPDKEQTKTLVKINNKWLVQFSKNDQMGGVGDPVDAADPSASDSSAAPSGAPMSDTTMH